MRPSPILLWAALSVPVAAQTFGPFTYDPAHAFGQAYDASGAILWSDFDADGDLDVAVGNAFGPEELFVNEGSGVYTRRLLPEQVQRIDAMGGAWADLDGDGRLDLLMCGLHAGGFVYWQGAGGSFEQEQLYDPNGVRDCSIADVNSDGRPDILVVHRSNESRPSKLFLNQGDRAFALGQEVSFGNGLQSSWADVDGDLDPDLYLAMHAGQPDRLFLNDDGVLRMVPEADWPQLATSSQSGSWGDYDGDGDFDLYATDYTGSNLIYRNEGGSFAVAATEASGTTLGATWGDVNNDGRLDRVSLDRGGPGRLRLRLAAGEEEVSLGSGDEGIPEGVTLVDHDGDGDLDLFVAYGRVNERQVNRVYLNQDEGGNWLKVVPYDVSGSGALGATVRVFDAEQGVSRAQTRAVLSRSGRKAQTGATLHFGLGESALVDSVVVRWPSGACRVLTDVRVNQTLRVTESPEGACAQPTEQAGSPAPLSMRLEPPSPNPSTRAVRLRWSAAAGAAYELEVVNTLGQVVHRESGVATGAPEMTVWKGGGSWSPGVYVVRLRQGDGSTLSRPFTVAR